MGMRSGLWCPMLVVVLASVVVAGTAGGEKPVLPEGEGLAGRYVGDRGIEGDAAVLFADGFESGDLRQWDENQAGAMRGAWM